MFCLQYLIERPTALAMEVRTMLCPGTSFDCDNPGCRHGGCQGRAPERPLLKLMSVADSASGEGVTTVRSDQITVMQAVGTQAIGQGPGIAQRTRRTEPMPRRLAAFAPD